MSTDGRAALLGVIDKLDADTKLGLSLGLVLNFGRTEGPKTKESEQDATDKKEA